MELRGKRAICDHTKRAWRTLQALAKKEGFPMTQVGRVWISDTDEIKDWRVRRLRRRSE